MEKKVFSHVCFSILLWIFSLIAVEGFSADATPPKQPGRNNLPGTIKVVMDNNYPPYTFLDNKGNLQGILIDQWKLWEQKTGIRVEISGMDWGEALIRMKQGKFDVIDTMFYNEQRTKIYDFSKPYVKIDVSIFFHKNISGISGTDSLQGFVVAAKKGDNTIDFLKEKGVTLIQEYPSYEAIVAAAKEQKVMVMVIDNPPALYFLHKTGIMNQYRYSAPLYTGEFHRAVRKGDRAILNLVEEGFSRISRSEYEAIHRKWFGAEVRLLFPYLRYVLMGLGCLIVVVLFMVVWNRMLQRKVHDRTVKLEEVISLNNKKTEELQISEEKYRELVENANSIILRMDITGKITFFNECASRFFGFSRDEIIGKNAVETIVPPSDNARKVFAQMIAGIGDRPDTYSNIEYQNICKDGNLIWVSWANKPVMDKQDRCAGILCIGNDMTERKKAEEAVKESEKRFRTLFRMAPVPMVHLSRGGKVLEVNDGFLETMGYTIEDMPTLEDMCALAFPDPDVKSDVLSKLRMNIGDAITDNSQMKPFECPFFCKDGITRTMVIGNEVVSDSVIVSFFDITIRKQAEEKLQQAEKRYRSIFEHAQEGIYRTTPEGRFIMANQAMARILGYESPEELLDNATDIDYQHYANPDDYVKVMNLIERQDFIKDYELQYVRKDRTPIWVYRTMRATRDDTGQLLYLEGIIGDITDRKKSVDQLRKALGGTVHAIALLTERKDPYTAGHQSRVADLARSIAKEMGLPADRIEGLRIAGKIHDIGKVAIPAEILSKPRRLSDIEFSLIKTHSQCGYDILKDVEFPWPIARIVLEHHERINGSGYPNGLTGDEILLESKILSVADVVEAMATDRPYRPGLGAEAALKEITRDRGVLYDAEVVDACLRLFNEKGYTIKL